MKYIVDPIIIKALFNFLNFIVKNIYIKVVTTIMRKKKIV